MTLPFDFWEQERRYLAGVIRGKLAQAAMLGVADGGQKLDQVGINFDNGLAHAQAVAWARQHTDLLLQQLGSTTQRGVGEILSTWMQTPGANLGDLEQLLMPLLDNNATRAQAVAVTETTRAFAEGNDIVYQGIGIGATLIKPPQHPNCRCTIIAKRVKSSNSWVSVWETVNDEITCTRPIETGTSLGTVEGCHALQGMVVSMGDYFGEYFDDL